MNNQSSLYGSSVRSYRNLDAANKPNLVKYLHTQEKIEPVSPHKDYTPLLPRNKSYDNFTSKLFDRPSRDPATTLPQRFYESIENSSSQQKYIGEIAALQNEITKLMANEVSLKTEKELLVKQGRRLREQIEYLNEKCSSLQAKNEQLFKSQSKMAILERQYSKVLVEFESFKSHCRIMHDPSAIEYLTNLPTKVEQNYEVEDEHYRIREREASRIIPQTQNNKFSGKVSQKVSWKKTSAAISPIHKLQHYRKYSGNRFDDLSLIESKIDKGRDEELGQQRADYYEQKLPTKTIDLKDLDKLKGYDSNMRALQSELKELRSKNTALYKRSEQGEHEKMKLLETINELSYEKSKLQTEHKGRENELRREIQRAKLDAEEKKIRIMELNESIENLTEAKKLAVMERAEMEEKLKALTGKNQKQSKTANEQNKSIVQLKQTLEKTEKQFIALKERWASLNKRHQQLQIQNKLHIHELEERKVQIAELEVQLQRLKQLQQSVHQAVLEEQSLLSKTENKIQMKPIQQKDEKSNTKLVQTEADGNFVKISEQLASLKDLHQRLMNEHNIWGFQLNKLKNQNQFLNENYLKLSSLYEQSRFDNQQLKELVAEWRVIEAKMRNMKHIDLTVDHLWQIKEVQYQNLHMTLSKIKKSLE